MYVSMMLCVSFVILHVLTYMQVKLVLWAKEELTFPDFDEIYGSDVVR